MSCFCTVMCVALVNFLANFFSLLWWFHLKEILQLICQSCCWQAPDSSPPLTMNSRPANILHAARRLWGALSVRGSPAFSFARGPHPVSQSVGTSSRSHQHACARVVHTPPARAITRLWFLPTGCQGNMYVVDLIFIFLINTVAEPHFTYSLDHSFLYVSEYPFTSFLGLFSHWIALLLIIKNNYYYECRSSMHSVDNMLSVVALLFHFKVSFHEQKLLLF